MVYCSIAHFLSHNFTRYPLINMSRRPSLLCILPHRRHRRRGPELVRTPLDAFSDNHFDGNSVKSNGILDQKPEPPSEIHPALRRRGVYYHSMNDSCVTFPPSVRPEATKKPKKEDPKDKHTEHVSAIPGHSPYRECPRADRRPRPQPRAILPAPYKPPERMVNGYTKPRVPKITCHPAEACPHLSERLTPEAADTACSLGLGIDWHCLCSNNSADWEECPFRPRFVYLRGMRFMSREGRRHTRQWLNDVANEGAPGSGSASRRRYSEP